MKICVWNGLSDQFKHYKGICSLNSFSIVDSKLFHTLFKQSENYYISIGYMYMYVCM